MSEKFRLDRKIGFQNKFYTKCINVIFDSIGPSIILRSIYSTAMSELHVYDETPNLVNFMLLSLTELYLQQIMQVSC